MTDRLQQKAEQVLREYFDYRGGTSQEVRKSNYFKLALAGIAAGIAMAAEREQQLLDALEEIAEGRGRFSMDKFTHARNTIEDMKELALNAIALAKREPQ